MEMDINYLESELNRGFLQVLVLLALERKTYGYRMLKDLEQMGYAVEENTLYPLLRRLEKNGWIAGEWDISEDRPKKFYVVTGEGRAIRQKALEIWGKQTEILDKLRKENRNV